MAHFRKCGKVRCSSHR